MNNTKFGLFMAAVLIGGISLIVGAGASVAITFATTGSPFLAFWTFFFTLHAVA